ncbi:MAG: lycopene cyclase domain-containing protein [Bacteroidetes bacterium]|nr:lycopene cyclase domain-containing protein [Bacteroidota bacterium]MCB0843449.1 lycopene cyclase domain-containing protein [Bacteroidota bacterium]
MYTYLILNILSFFFPFILSFDKKVAFYKSWKALFPAIFIIGAWFIIWDVYFTEWGVWEFNDAYITGIKFLGLPMEEWMFFFTVPYACVFIYACLNVYIKRDILEPYAKGISYGILFLSIILTITHWDHLYTRVTFFSLTILMLLNVFVIRGKYMGRYYLAYLVSLIPFLLVNGVLTAYPVVIYNDLENLGIRIGSIPADDTGYLMVLLVSIINIYEFLENRSSKKEVVVRSVSQVGS